MLWYDDDVPGKVLNERIRFDVLAIQPELMTNGMRALPNNNYYHIYNGYCEGITFTDETDLSLMMVYGNANCCAYEQDEPQFKDGYDVTFKLPRVPNEGTSSYYTRLAVDLLCSPISLVA